MTAYIIKMLYIAYIYSYLARSANLPGRAIYFANVFSLFFSRRLSNTCISEANRPIFNKISGLVDGCKGLFLSLIHISEPTRPY